MTFDLAGTPNHWVRMEGVTDFSPDFEALSAASTWKLIAFGEDPTSGDARADFETAVTTAARCLVP